MKKYFFIFLFLPTLLFSQKPKLVVAVVIDQMRFEMLERFSTTFGEDGFKKLQKEGFSFNNCNYNYIPTYTGPGHATIFSGQDPKKHGIIANDWYDRKDNTMVYCVEDNSVQSTGSSTKGGNRSPKNYKSSSLADLVKHSSKSKVFGVSVKDRGAILPAGRKANGAFWMDESANFMSSTFYGKTLPEWLITFNAEQRAEKYTQKEWSLSLKPERYINSDNDERTVEEKPFGENASFPYDLKKSAERKGTGIIKYTPYGNIILTDVALALMENEELGKDDHMDFFSISYSSTDYAGHAFGPRSVEIQDMYIKLDLEVARLINYLDTEVGSGEYVLFLTSDHGAVDCPGTKTNPAEYVIRADLKNSIDSISKAEFGVDLVSKVSNFQIWFDLDLIDERSLQINDVASLMAEKLKAYKQGKFISKAWTRNELLKCELPTCEQFKRTYTTNLSGDVFFMTTKNYLINSNEKGTSHGTGYSYDTHVPLFFYGMNILPGKSNENIVVQDIAPTLIDVIKVQTSAKFDGESRINLMN